MVTDVLQRDGTTYVEPIKYGFLDVFRFWCPILTRRASIKHVLWKIDHALGAHKDCELLIIAHSFGTYAIARILQDQPRIRPTRMVFCGSIVRPNLRWDKIPQRPQIINDCGTRDLWPILAAATTWGYGPSGTFGFGTPGIRDRYHDFAHSDYFERVFVETYWRPWIHDGRAETTHYV
jgi:alpha-beta hydrolase superfamily lysophospholipase